MNSFLSPARYRRHIHAAGVAACLMLASSVASAQTAAPAADPNHVLLQRYCIGCHNAKVKTAGVSLQGLDLKTVGPQAELLEKVLRKVKTGQMPPAGAPRPKPEATASFNKWLETSLDAEAAARPNPGRPSVHRLNRAEYSNAVRDVFALDVNPGAMLPVDDSGYGFDNIGDVLSVSPALLDRYISVARKVSRLIVGDPTIKPVEEVFEPRREPNQATAVVPSRLEWVSEDLPFNSAGGLSVRYYFPLDATYILRVKIGGDNSKPMEVRLPVKAGLRTVGVTFPRESLRPEPLGGPGGRRGPAGPPPGPGGANQTVSVDIRLDGASVHRGTTRGNPNGLPRITNLGVAGPYEATGSGDTPSRAKVFICNPATAAEETPCASKILGNLTRYAYRRAVTESDVRPLVAFYAKAREKGNFEYGIQKAIEAILISPDFLFRVESEPLTSKAKTAAIHRISGYELASRLSFFLWSSVPDEPLLDLAGKGKLSDPAILKQQVQRMLDDPRSDALVKNFAGQWLHVRNLATVKPDPVVFSQFDESLRYAMQRETELFFESVVRENRSAIDLLAANYTFLNERLAKHYGIPKIYGSQFRRVTLDDPNRGGLLGHASVLTVTSPPNRTSVVQRGKWVLENMLGAPPPPPPPDVPSLEATTKGNDTLSLRKALEQHRASPSCSGCHAVMDPIGFALENYNGIGQWRSEDAGIAIDSSGKLPDGTQFVGPTGLKKTMTTGRPEEFVSTVAEKLLTYALGRGVEYYDQPVVRTIVRQSEPGGYRLGDMITSVVLSTPFQMRRSADQ